LVGWFAVELRSDSPRVGLAERMAAGAQALWPLAVVAGAGGGRSSRGYQTRQNGWPAGSA
ncbi:MAG: hypothetical protein M3P48_06825, partial [Actinomycetota bacterium]|nr:hypothetical protein [Actinomycetota bacterium]